MEELNKILKEYKLTTQEIASIVGLTDARIRQLAPLMEVMRHSLKICGAWRFRTSAIEWLANRHLYL